MDITVESRALVVVAGLPGAGKSTLLRRTRANVPIAVIDTDQLRTWFRRVLPARTPYAVCRPVVHILHTLRVLIMVVCSERPIVLHDPATRTSTRVLFAVVGALTGRRRHLIWVDCTPAEALAGQEQRGRVLLKWAFAGHVRRSPELRRQLTNGRLRGWHSAQVVDRSAASKGLRLQVA
ncbi:AAA family ATPase [Actinocrispum sp. NPDC049592]|uniref:AAA family ATPase n=1 Tax=Actinocrispum sp. NPDC049592 TaxID=3154835 RepID=UPI003441154A